MKIFMQEGSDSSELDFDKWDVGLVGSAVDDRGNNSIEFLETNTDRIHRIFYNSDEINLIIDDQKFEVSQIESLSEKYINSRIVLDITTLNIPELLLIINSFQKLNISSYDILYLEPQVYKRKPSSHKLESRDFELTEKVNGYMAIPGNALSLPSYDEQRVIFISGYEAERIDRAFEESEIAGEKTSCIFGVPAFNSGWEMNAFANTIPVLKERKIRGGIYYCGANNPLAVLNKLNDIYDGLNLDEKLFIAPLSCKPMNLGACLFIATKPKDKVAILYDHPSESKNRSEKISKWHIFNVSN